MIDTAKDVTPPSPACAPRQGARSASCRYELASLDDRAREYQCLIDVFKAHDIGFFYNGAGDSQDRAHKVSLLGERLGYPLVCIGIPKTVDNDLPGTDTCPGFGSGAKYMAVAVREATLDMASATDVERAYSVGNTPWTSRSPARTR